MRDVSDEAAELRRRIDYELAESSKEREAAEEALAKAHNEMAALMDVKLNLEAEISAYRCLLNAQGGILQAGSPSKPRLSRDVYSKPRPSSVSPQRRMTGPPIPVSDM